jgi:hypothetical protein
MENEIEEMRPSAARLIESLRDTGYTFTTSVADIIDNSVAADATKIEVILNTDFAKNPFMWIVDNGEGMSSNELEKAMQYGSPLRPSPKSLGKFGMGLKTASTSFCRKLTVISKKGGELALRQWDLDVVAEKDRWLLLKPDSKDFIEQIELLNQVAKNGSGTIVVWENIDRLVRLSGAAKPEAQLEKLSEELGLHLSGVFFNFLESENGAGTIELKINGVALEPWDPFCQWMNTGENPNRVEIHRNNPFQISEHLDNGVEIKGEFTINVYILPNKNELSGKELAKARYGLDNQGFHVFREGRMIYSGGWPNRLFVKEPHLNLIRVELQFDHKLDHFFQIDIKKSRIDIPKEIRDELKKVLTPARNEANARYRKGKSKRSDKGGVLDDQHSKSSTAITKHHDEATSNSALTETDQITGHAKVRNKYGITEIRINFQTHTDKVVETENNLEDGVLWAPSLANGNKHAVVVNESHEFYRKYYLPNKNNTTLVMAMDALLWSLAEAELSVINDQAKRNLEELRINVSRNLRILASELPEVDEDSESYEEDIDE